MSLTNETKYDEVKPTVPVAPYMGGKSRLAKTIITRINSIEHDTYCEPFVGMGGIFFRRNMRPRAEFINDFNGEVVNLFRILREHYPQFMEVMKFQITSRREFDRLAKIDPSTLTDLQRAARFLYLQKTSFGGKVSGQNFGVSKDRGGRFDITKIAPILEDVYERLAGVTIENLSFEKFIPRYDKAGALFYIDPPYYTNENDYGKGMFKQSDFEVLNELLKGLKGRFILSLNDRPEVREIFNSFEIEVVNVTYTLASKSAKKVGEVMVSN
ncbi:MAG: DNA methyltransferase [Hyphomicrobiales bacterium]|nr:MAG: DNA methyltransferase [Hyphomicrobiales bacterium]